MTVKWTLKSHTADEAAFAKPLALGNIVRPDWVYRFAQDEESTYYADMRAKVGMTWGEYYANLTAFANDIEPTETLDYESLKDAFVQACYQEVRDTAEARNVTNVAFSRCCA